MLLPSTTKRKECWWYLWYNIEVCLSHWYAAAADDEKGMLMGYLMLAVVISKRAYWYAAADDKEMGMLAECLVLVPVHFVDN